MFSVVFEVYPRPDHWDAYLGTAQTLRPELEQVSGFIDNVRYKSLRREGWLLSLSGWRDEKSLVRWRTAMRHHLAQEKGRSEILRDYHLRVGQVIDDTHVPEGHGLREQRLDETEVGEGTALTLITGKKPPGWDTATGAKEAALHLGLDPNAIGIVSWDILEAVLTPGDLILLACWRTQRDAERFAAETLLPSEARLRRIRVVRDYRMLDRREAPQYYPGPDALRAE